MMTVLGSLGVFLLLLAFVLNLIRKLSESDPRYLMMNACGAAAAAWYAAASGSWPFVVLESVWAAAAIVRLGGVIKKGSR
ncbi:MAG: hypothetical protein AB1644_13275 [Candidatus Zixiibacteriota bacterium]